MSLNTLAAEIDRKRLNARKYLIGGMACRFGLDRWSDTELLGLFATYEILHPYDRTQLLAKGAAILEKDERLKRAKPVFALAKFDSEIDRSSISGPIKEYGLRWDRDLQCYRGRVLDLHLEALEQFVTDQGGHLSKPDPTTLLVASPTRPASTPATTSKGTVGANS